MKQGQHITSRTAQPWTTAYSRHEAWAEQHQPRARPPPRHWAGRVRPNPPVGSVPELANDLRELRVGPGGIDDLWDVRVAS